MLQAAARNTRERQPELPGAMMKQAARGLHDALSRLERAIAQRPSPVMPEGGEAVRAAQLEQENASLQRQNVRLLEENAQLATSHLQAAEQIHTISQRLNTLIARVAGLLDE